jgi:hypothetical protein
VTRLAEVKDLIRDTNVAEATKADQSNFKILFRAVAAHRKASIEGDYEPETHDLDLWSVYDDIRANNHTQAHAL